MLGVDIENINWENEGQNTWQRNAEAPQNNLKKVRGMDFWVCYKRDGREVKIEYMGKLNIEPVSLDEGKISKKIRNSANELINFHPEEKRLAKSLVKNSDEIAITLEDVWQQKCEEVLVSSAENGELKVSGRYCFATTNEIYETEIQKALETNSVCDNSRERAFSIVLKAFLSVLGNKKDEQTPFFNYMGLLKEKK